MGEGKGRREGEKERKEGVVENRGKGGYKRREKRKRGNRKGKGKALVTQLVERLPSK